MTVLPGMRDESPHRASHIGVPFARVLHEYRLYDEERIYK